MINNRIINILIGAVIIAGAWVVSMIVTAILAPVIGNEYQKTTTNSYKVRVTHRVASSHAQQRIGIDDSTIHSTSEAARSVETPVSHKLESKTDHKTDKAGGAITDEQIIEYIRSKDWDDSIAIRIAKSENAWNLTHSFDCSRVGYNNDKVKSRDRGIFQINDYWHPHFSDAQAFDCFQNIDYAYEIYKSRGNWSAWYAYSNGSYLNHSDE